MSDQGIHRSAVRLLFAFEGRDVRLLRKQWLSMVAPPSDRFPKRDERQEPMAGFWVDLLDGEEQVVYRRVFGENPMSAGIAVYTGDKDHPFTMQRTAEPKGDFMVVVPDIPEATSVALFGSPPAQEGFAAAEELARFGLKEEGRGADR